MVGIKADGPTNIACPKNKANSLTKKENLVGWLYCSPIIIGILAFTLIPVILSLIAMFHAWDGTKFVTDTAAVGWQNFEYIFKPGLQYHDQFIKAIGNTFLFAIQVPVSIIIGMFLGLALNRKMHGVQAFRILYYLPSVMSVVAVTIVFQKIFDYDGYINTVLVNLGGHRIDWIKSNTGIVFTANFMMVWKGIGYDALMFVAGLQSVSTDQIEAAKIDGATGWVLFYKIMLPALYPITFYLLVTGLMGGLQVFNEPYILAEWGTDFNAMTLVSLVYYCKQAKMAGMSCVVAWFLAILIFIVTAIQMAVDRRVDKEA